MKKRRNKFSVTEEHQPKVQEPTNNDISDNPENVTSQEEPVPPIPIPGVPIGLEPLFPVDRILVKRLGGYQDYYSAVKEVNRFEIFISTDERIYIASETEDLAICIHDSSGRCVMTINRRNCLRAAVMLFITLGDESKLGGVTKLLRCCTEKVVITDESDTKIMELKAPCCGNRSSCCSTDHYSILTNAGKQMGCIRRSRGVLELLTGADNYQVEFSSDLNIQSKALMMAAVFLIDFLYYESGDRNQFRHNEELMTAATDNPTIDLNTRIATDEFFESEIPIYTSQL